MISVAGGSKMPCESCGVQFSVFRRKRACSECERLYCAACLRRGGGMCVPCRALSTRPLARHAIAHLKARDLQCFLQRQNVSTRGCVEKEELVSLCLSHVNSTAYRRRGPRSSPGPFTTLKGLTTNINDLLNSAFDLRPNAPPNVPPQQPPTTRSNCYNAAHSHSTASQPAPPPPRERFTMTPGGERDIFVPPPEPGAGGAAEDTPRVDTADCFEVEDVDDAGWEFVTRPAEPLPGDSEVLLTANEECRRAEREEQPQPTAPRIDPIGLLGARYGEAGAGGGGAAALRAGGTPQRAASELNLSRREPPPPADTDTASLQDEPLMDHPETASESCGVSGGGGGGGGGALSLSALREEAELERLSVKQLKQLLARHRVEFRGCIERAELLQRARLLYRDHAKTKDVVVDALPLEECCKICMAAPLECVLLECGHIAACTACSKQLAECPICRQYVVRAVRFFRS